MEIPSYKIRNIEVNPGLVLSPMSGITCSAFRRLIKDLNPGCVGLLVSEFVSIEGMTRGSKKTMEMVRFHESERPYCVQIFGYDVDRMAEAAKVVESIGADLVDINCGCPAPKVVKRGGGCELMRQPDHLKQIFSAVRKAVNIPVTMKMRSGWDETSRNCLEIAHIAYEEGMEAIAVHGRTRAQLYRGEADWDIIEAVADAVPIPVLGSGDVVDYQSAQERLKGKVAGLFIGRAALFHPFVFTEIIHNRKIDVSDDPHLALSVIDRYLRYMQEDNYTPTATIGKLKQLCSQFLHGYTWRKSILRCQTLEQIQGILQGVRDGTFQEARAPRSEYQEESSIA